MSTEKKTQAEKFKMWVLGIINGIDARMLVDMIKANEIPTLWEYELPPYLNFVKNLVIENQEAILEQLTLEVVMAYCKEYRPDLAKILIHKKAQQWMSRFLKKTAFMIKHIDLEPYEIQAKYEERIRELLSQREAQQADKLMDILAKQQPETLEPPPELIPEEAPVHTIEKIDYDNLTDEDLAMALGKKRIDDDYDFI